MSELVGPVYARQAYAGFFRRTLALVFDLLILTTASFLMAWGWYYLAPPLWVTEESYAWVEAVHFVLIFVYMIGFRFFMRGTPGYRIVGIRYAYVLSRRPSVWAIAYRSLMAVVLMLFFALDHIWILFDDRKQAWHDKVTGFYVIKRNAQPVGTQRVVQRVINFWMLTFIVWEPVDATPSSDSGG